MKRILPVFVSSLFILVGTSAQAQICQGSGAGPVNGANAVCTNFRVALIDIGPIEPGFDITDEGWVWVARGNPDPTLPTTRCVSGVVLSSNMASNDTPANHNSHDWVFHLEVDPGMQDALSNVNGPNDGDRDNDLVPDDEHQTVTPEEIEVEWESGIIPSEKSGDGSLHYFPKWAWPSAGDRAWADGNWVFDCGHGKEIGHIEIDQETNLPKFVGDEYFRTEIHPARAVAAMRRQVSTLTGSGTTPVPVTATDLYIHGRGGFVTDILHCGMSIILDGVDTDHDGNGDGNPDACPIKTTPIAEDFQFEVCLPPRPHPAASLQWDVEAGPGDTVPSIAPDIREQHASPACANDGDEDPGTFLYDQTTSLLVTIPLHGTGIADTEVYARRIRAGWVFPDPTIRHLTVTLQQMDLHNDHDDVPTDTGELTFFFMNVSTAADEWARLSDFDIPTHDSCGALCFEHTNTMNDYDDDDLCCNGLLNFSGPVYDFYIAGGRSFTIRANGYDQDCYDFHDNFGDHNLSLGLYAACHTVDITEFGGNDPMVPLPTKLEGHQSETTFGPPDYGVGFQDLHAWRLVQLPGQPEPTLTSDYELEVMIGEIPLGLEDTADLSVDKTCVADGEVALVGQPVHCTITVQNPGPGLPRGVTIGDTLTGAGPFVLGPATLTVGNSASVPCTVTGTGAFTCDAGTIPVGGTGTVTVDVTPLAGGIYTNTASVSTASTDPVATNNQDSSTIDVFIPVTIDIHPGTTPNPINPDRSGSIPVAILTTPTFDAATVNFATACWGDDGAPAERDCTETHGTGHLRDVDKDRDDDLLLHFDMPGAGIDAGDTKACLTARTFGGVGVYGCDSVKTN